MKVLLKTTIIIWFDPKDLHNPLDLEDLARAAVDGAAYCSRQTIVLIEDPTADPEWDGTEFFD